MNTKESLFYKEYYPAIKEVEIDLLAKICNLLQDWSEQENDSLVEHITSRIKTPESVSRKLTRGGYEPTEINAIEKLSDVVGLRLIVHFVGDIYTLRNLLIRSGEFDVVKEKDYVQNAKPSGYRGYHIIVSSKYNDTPIRAEIQIRTIAMDCWASLEHRIRYKKDMSQIKEIEDELKKCADDLMVSDETMEKIWKMTADKRKGF